MPYLARELPPDDAPWQERARVAGRCWVERADDRWAVLDLAGRITFGNRVHAPWRFFREADIVSGRIDKQVDRLAQGLHLPCPRP